MRGPADRTMETRTHWDNAGRFFLEYPAQWQVFEASDKVVMTAVPSNGCVVSVDFHSPGHGIVPSTYGFKDTAAGVCQVYMRDAVQNGRPTRGPVELKIPGADDAAWAAWEWNGNISEFVIFRVDEDYKKVELQYLGTAAPIRDQALTPLQTLRIKSRNAQVASNPAASVPVPPHQNIPQRGTADEGFVAPSLAGPARPVHPTVQTPPVRTYIPPQPSNPSDQSPVVTPRSRGFLGVQFDEKPFSTIFGDGLVINSVFERQAGAEAGIRAGDVILELDRKRVTTTSEFKDIVQTLEPEKQYPITVKRDGGRLELKITPHGWPDELQQVKLLGIRIEAVTLENSHLAGLTGIEIKFNFSQGKGDAFGLLITNVEPNGLGATFGLQRYDVITAVGAVSTTKPAPFHAALKRATEGGDFLLHIRRDGKRLTVVVRGVPSSKEESAGIPSAKESSVSAPSLSAVSSTNTPSLKLASALAAEAAERSRIEWIMAQPLDDLHSSQLQVLYSKPFARNIPDHPTPVFSGDGEKVMYPQIENGQLTLIVANLTDHQTLLKWTPSETPFTLAWSRDGKQLAYLASKLHVVMDLGTPKDVVLPVMLNDRGQELIWISNGKLAFIARRNAQIDVLDIDTLEFEPMIAQQPNRKIRDAEFERKLSELQSSQRDHKHCKISVRQYVGAFVAEHDGSDSQLLLHRSDFCEIIASPDLRHILEYGHNNKRVLTHYFVGLRRTARKHFWIDLNPSQLRSEDTQRFNSDLQGGRPFWGRVYSPLKNPLNGKVVGPDQKSFKGFVRVHDWQKSLVKVSNSAETVPMHEGDIVADIQSGDPGTKGYVFAFKTDIWFPLRRDTTGDIQRAYQELKVGGSEPSTDISLTLDEIRKRCDLWDVHLANNDLVTLKADDRVVEFQAGETPESFADNLFAEYRTLPQPTRPVLILFSQANPVIEIDNELGLAVERMQIDAKGRTRFGLVSLGFVGASTSQIPKLR